MRNGDKKTGETVTLVAVTKNHPADVVLASRALGISDVGENRVQEAKQKKTVVPSGQRWHLLGHLQTNKVKQAVEIFDIIESVDSEKILAAIDKAAEQQGKVQEVLLQLNIAEEEQKSGFDKESYEAILPELRNFKNVRVRGIMVIAQKAEDVEETRPVFRKGYEKFCELREYLGESHIDILSMGMTHDYWIAVEEGANSVRIGTALFGERDYGRYNSRGHDVKMKIVEKICDTLGLYKEVEEDVVEQEEALPDPKRNFVRSSEQPREEKSPFFSKKQAGEDGKLISLPLAQKQVKVIVLEPTGFDDSQKVADHLRTNQPVVVNFETTDGEVMKRMTDFISGTVYALNGSMKKIGRNILVCAPQNVDIDAGRTVYNEKGEAPWEK